MTIHNFQESLAWSEEQADAPWWEQVYRKAWPDLKAMVSVREDGWAQRAGIDRVLTLASGKVLKIDEKVRRQAYGDFFLEYLSAKEFNTPGWIEKPLDCDYIAYAFEPIATCYLLPTQELQRAWRNNKAQWLERYTPKEALNGTYTTVGLPVPKDVVWAGLKDAMRIEWTP